MSYSIPCESVFAGSLGCPHKEFKVYEYAQRDNIYMLEKGRSLASDRFGFYCGEHVAPNKGFIVE